MQVRACSNIDAFQDVAHIRRKMQFALAAEQRASDRHPLRPTNWVDRTDAFGARVACFVDVCDVFVISDHWKAHMKKPAVETQSQRDNFVEAAHKLGCDESEATFDAALKKVAAHKPTNRPPAPEKKSMTKKPAK